MLPGGSLIFLHVIVFCSDYQFEPYTSTYVRRYTVYVSWPHTQHFQQQLPPEKTPSVASQLQKGVRQRTNLNLYSMHVSRISQGWLSWFQLAF